MVCIRVKTDTEPTTIAVGKEQKNIATTTKKRNNTVQTVRIGWHERARKDPSGKKESETARQQHKQMRWNEKKEERK